MKPSPNVRRQRPLRNEKLFSSGKALVRRFPTPFRNEDNRFLCEEGFPGSMLTLPAFFSLRSQDIYRTLVKQAIPLGSLALTVAVLTSCNHSSNSSLAKGGKALDFNQDVQPILAARCFSCHGPDPEMRKAGLRLDLGEYATKKRPGRPDAIGPGHPAKSELIRRIKPRDPHYLMPQNPQGEGKPMSESEIATLKEWIREG